ncbi:malto-oligosyltrehalose synthase [Actinomycetospora sp. TBRC 11914]|uniref:malto-oligosyltrehalose synthase n=1 Tax=Actinomycetospora sp. TBRC 11914 TaxID=2729387 RepID=UPI00145F5DD8|nr:malto-oligosyltrehalose synthase [Actinomycetospora sp. TBRC 11914]NMO93810.1 malto-oligosyltrehalose synthase [Actinomycetospora sp. TBRC 11914]
MVPSSTYRLQLAPDQDLAAATDLVGYLSDLGVGALYCSPLLQPAPGSTHGYDVVDPTHANDELGGEPARVALVAALREAGLRALLDLVPNHMGVAVPPANPSWWSLLRLGTDSPYASWYDVDLSDLAERPILIPVLGSPEDVSALELSDDRTELRYYEHRYPVAPGTADEGSPQEVHERQHYRLVHWRRGNAELTYRRFFDVSDLAAVRVEDPEVFEATHAEVLRWIAADPDVLSGLRIDHPDGLTAPGAYLRRLRARLTETGLGEDAWLLVEKITSLRADGTTEALPSSWPADGTTGYDALREVCGVFVDPRGESLIDQVAAEHTGGRERLSVAEHAAKRLVTDEILVAEVRRIAALVPGDDEPGVVRDAVAELLGAFPVYRSYLPEGRADLERAVDTACTARPDLAEAVRRIRAGMLAEPDGDLARRFEQTSGMVTAKGVEDTTFYRWNRFVALNEVGGAPDRFGVRPAEFHAANAHRDAATPAAMTTLSTHDTKRSEDVRARLAVLSELTAEWGAFLRKLAARHPLPRPGATSPSLELLAWQSLVGAWPISAERFRGYLTKASKEAKLVTAHVDAVPEVDEAIAAWPDAVLGSEESVADIEAFVRLIDRFGRSNGLGQKLLQLAGPGVPDVYQGTELFEFSLVDPDNRRPVDFARRRELLARLDGGWMPAPVAATDDPASDDLVATKLVVTTAALRLRRFRPELFWGYAPVPASGPAADHAVAFARGGPAGRERLVAVATRLPAGLEAEGGWRDTVLPLPGGAEDWTDMVTGTPVSGAAPRVSELLARYPVALLVRPA